MSSDNIELASLQLAVQAQGGDVPIYVRIATALSAQIASGNLKHKDRLPSHRMLAQALGVNLTTITKSFKYLKERGVVSANAGQGTVVRGRELDHVPPSYEQTNPVPRFDLSVLKRHGSMFDETAVKVLRAMGRDTACLDLLTEYRPSAGSLQMRDIGARWFLDWGVRATAECTAATAGAQHALFVVLSATMKAGDIVLVPSLCYQGIKTAAQQLGLGLISVATDEDGVIPDALERHARNPRVRTIFVCPTLDNPRSVTLSEERRSAIARIASKHALQVIEDDVYRPLCTSRQTSIFDLYPARTFHISSVAKVLAPGMRCGFLAHPPEYTDALHAALRGTVWMADPFSAYITEALVRSGRHRDLVNELRRLMRRRHRAAVKLLGERVPGYCEPEGNCLWIDLPSTSPADRFTDDLRAQGIGVAPSSTFETGTSQHNGVRLYKGSAESDTDWNHALTVLCAQIDRPRVAREIV